MAQDMPQSPRLAAKIKNLRILPDSPESRQFIVVLRRIQDSHSVQPEREATKR